MRSIALATGEDGKLGAVLKEIEAPDPARGEIVVDMRACGLCGTDIEKMRGEYTASMPILGHEAVGVISEVGDGVTGLSRGERVFPHHHVPCYECYHCRAGDETMCDMYRKSNIHPGGFSEKFRVPEWNIVKGGVLKLPDEMSFEAGALIEPVACCLRAVRKHARSGETVLVVGAGPVGLMNALLLEPMEVKVLISDVIPSRIEFASRLNVGTVLNASKEDVRGSVLSETQGRGADLAIVASGSSAAILQGLGAIRKGGRACLFGVPPMGSMLAYDLATLYNSGQEIVTSYGASDIDTKGAIGILGANPEFLRLVTHRIPLERFGDAVEAVSDGTAVKVAITP